MYLPCVTSDNDCIAEIERIFSEIHAVIDENMSVDQHLLLMGDFNCSYGDMQLKLNLSAIKTFTDDWQLNLCNIKSISGNYNTYRNFAVGHFSKIDHMFCTEQLKQAYIECHIVEHAANLSDHCPVATGFELNNMKVLSDAINLTNTTKNINYRWSQQDVAHYNAATYNCGYFCELHNAVEEIKKVYRACKCCETKVNSLYDRTIVSCLNGIQCAKKAIDNLAIDNLYTQIISTLLKCSEECKIYNRNEEATIKVPWSTDLANKKEQ